MHLITGKRGVGVFTFRERKEIREDGVRSFWRKGLLCMMVTVVCLGEHKGGGG